MARESGIFQWIAGSMDKTLDSFISVTASSVIENFTILIISAGTLHFVLLGCMMILGQVQSPWSSFLKSGLKFAFIGALALNASTYMEWVVAALRGLETGITSAFAATTGGPSDNVFQVIDRAISDGFGIGQGMLSKMGKREWYEFPLVIWDLINALLIFIATLLIAVPAGAMIVVSKAMLSIMLGIGPIFIAMLLFGQFTSKWFDSWFSQVMTYIMQIALVTTVLSFGIKFFSTLVAEVLKNPADYPISTMLEILIVTIVVLYMLQTANQVAGALAGGLTSAGLTLRNVASPVSRLVNGKSTRRDLESGMMVTAGRTNHILAGNTPLNPAYRQHVMQNLGKNWGRVKGGAVKQ